MIILWKFCYGGKLLSRIYAMQLMYGIVMQNKVHETQVPATATIAVSEKDVLSCFFEKL